MYLFTVLFTYNKNEKNWTNLIEFTGRASTPCRKTKKTLNHYVLLKCTSSARYFFFFFILPCFRLKQYKKTINTVKNRYLHFWFSNALCIFFFYWYVYDTYTMFSFPFCRIFSPSFTGHPTNNNNNCLRTHFTAVRLWPRISK